MKSTIQYDTDKGVFIRGESEYKTVRNRDMMLNRELTKCLQFQSIFSPPVQRFWMILVHKVATLVLAHCCLQFQCTLFAVSVHITLGKTETCLLQKIIKLKRDRHGICQIFYTRARISKCGK